MVSAMIRVRPSSVMTVPLGNCEVGGGLAAGAVGVDPDQRGRRDVTGLDACRRRGRRGRSRSCRRRPGRWRPPPCRWRARWPRAAGRRGPRGMPSGSRRMMTRSRRELMRRRPSGSQPRPAGSPSKSTSTRRSPSGETEKTAWSKKSEYHSRPSCQRGHSPKKRPERNGSAVRVSLVTVRSSRPEAVRALQFSTARPRRAGRARGLPWSSWRTGCSRRS